MTASVGLEFYTIRPGERLNTLLLRNGIEPDGNAYTFLYAANPTLQNVDQITAGQSLLLPTIEGPSVAEAAFGRRYLARLGVYGPSRQQLVTRADDATQLLSEVLRAPEVYFPDAQHPNLTVSLERLRRTLDGLEFERTVVGEQMLEIMNFEIELASALLSKAVQSSTALNPDELQVLIALETSFSELATCALTAVKCEVGVQVRTLGTNGTPRNGIQVFAAPFGMISAPNCATDPRCRRSFRRVSSPAEHDLPADAHFVIWAEHDGQIISDQKSFRPKRTGPNELDLLLREQ